MGPPGDAGIISNRAQPPVAAKAKPKRNPTGCYRHSHWNRFVFVSRGGIFAAKKWADDITIVLIRNREQMFAEHMNQHVLFSAETYEARLRPPVHGIAK